MNWIGGSRVVIPFGHEWFLGIQNQGMNRLVVIEMEFVVHIPCVVQSSRMLLGACLDGGALLWVW